MFNIKTNRTFTFIRQYGFIFTLLVAFGGLYYPKLGLLVLPVMIGLMITAFFKGRYWCGNICAHGSLFDAVIIKVSRNEKIPKFFKSKFVYIPFFLLFGYKIVNGLIRVSKIYGTASYFDRIGFIFVSSYIMVTLLGGTLGLFFAPRTWCNFCPMGVLQKLSYRLGKLVGVTKITDEKVTVASPEMCHTCGKCERVCPMQLAPYRDFEPNHQFENENCIKCATCVYNCPAHILTISTEHTAGYIKKNVDLTGYENRQKISAVVESIIDMPNDIKEYTFKFVEPEVVDYKAGQFILIKIQDEPEMYRAYSISSFNEDGRSVSITIKKVTNGYGTSKIFDDIKVGDPIQLDGPMGRDLLVDEKADKVLLIGGGIGITPFIPIIKDLREKNFVSDVKLLYGANMENEFIYSDEFDALDNDYSEFELRRIAAFDEEWTGRRGFVTDHMEDIEDIESYKVYMCGPPAMVNASTKKLLSLGVKEANIKYESA